MTPEPQDVKPLPCPFCGAEAVTPYHLRYQDEAHTRCAVRGCTGDAIGVPVSAWNRRAPSPSTGGASSLRAQIEALVCYEPVLSMDELSVRVTMQARKGGTFVQVVDVLALCGDAHGGGTSPQYYVGADRGDLWIPVHTTGCATEEEARKVLDLVRKGDEEGGPFAVIRSYEDFTPTKVPSLSTLRAQIEGLPAVPRHLRITSDCLSRAEVLALFDALTIPEEK